MDVELIAATDNSSSMQEEDRIPDLRDTVGRVAQFATILSPDGMYIRRLNEDHLPTRFWNGLKTVDDVDRKMDQVSYDGGTPLGQRLRDKILEPLVLDKAFVNMLKKPVVVITITDGELSKQYKFELEIVTKFPSQATDPDSNPLRDSIGDYNMMMKRMGYDDAFVVFLHLSHPN